MWHKPRVAGDARHRGPRASRGLEASGAPADGRQPRRDDHTAVVLAVRWRSRRAWDSVWVSCSKYARISARLAGQAVQDDARERFRRRSHGAVRLRIKGAH